MSILSNPGPTVKPADRSYSASDRDARPIDPLTYIRAQAWYYRQQGGWAELIAEAIEGLTSGIVACSTPGMPLDLKTYRERLATLDAMAEDDDPRTERRAAPGRNVAPIDPEEAVEF
jgi:hypothetical protein